MNPLFLYLGPPLVGAAIGYMTNHVAIRMLFRPLRPWRLFGLRLPLTPGVIPARRHELARNIGEMVGDHLLTADDIGRAVGEEKFQRELQRVIDDRVREMLSRDLGPLPEIVPDRFRESFGKGVRILRWRFLRQVHGYLASDSLAARLRPQLATFVDLLLATDLEKLAGQVAGREKLLAGIEGGLRALLTGEEAKRYIKILATQAVARFSAEERSLAEILPEDMRQAITRHIAAETPALLGKAVTLLGEPVVRDRLARAARGGFEKFLTSLGPLAMMAANFVKPETVEQKVSAYLAERQDEIASWILDPQVEEKAAGLLVEQVKQVFEKPLAQLAQNLGEKERVALAHALAAGIENWLEENDPAPALAGLVGGMLEERAGMPVGALLDDLLGGGTAGLFRERLVEAAIGSLSAPAFRKMVDELLVELIENKVLNRPLGTLGALLPGDIRRGLSGFFREWVNELLRREVSVLVASLRIRETVTRKVDELDLLRLERLILSIMEKQFTAINLFGALLGFLMGCVNLLFLQVM